MNPLRFSCFNCEECGGEGEWGKHISPADIVEGICVQGNTYHCVQRGTHHEARSTWRMYFKYHVLFREKIAKPQRVFFLILSRHSQSCSHCLSEFTNQFRSFCVLSCLNLFRSRGGEERSR